MRFLLFSNHSQVHGLYLFSMLVVCLHCTLSFRLVVVGCADKDVSIFPMRRWWWCAWEDFFELFVATRRRWTWLLESYLCKTLCSHDCCWRGTSIRHSCTFINTYMALCSCVFSSLLRLEKVFFPIWGQTLILRLYDDGLGWRLCFTSLLREL